ncbi:MAG: mRNA cap guanine-N7 methyltransferase [Bathelium mastoideum]|nr:MAG: mRNA cap guanine-N7 methyltransferase [Bathelium mastoideum]
MADRRGSVMFDPARDHFVSTDEAQNTDLSSPEQTQPKKPQGSVDEKIDMPSKPAMNGRKRSRSPESDVVQSSSPQQANGIEYGPSSQTITEEPAVKKHKATQNDSIPSSSSGLLDAKKLPKIPRKQKDASGSSLPSKPRKQHPINRRAEKAAARRRPSPPSSTLARDPSPIRDPSPPRRSRSPSRSRSRSPPRQRKRPGAGARLDRAEVERVRRLQAERERAAQDRTTGQLVARGVQDVVRQHYNAVPERGREWRRTDSKIKGLRSFNNWVKSAVIQKFSPAEDHAPGSGGAGAGAERRGGGGGGPGLLVLDIGCGKGGDLQKWQQAPQRVDLYVGLDPADVSVEQARERYAQMQRGRGGPRGRPQQTFEGHFFTKDCFGEWLGEIPIIREVGIDANIGPGANPMAARFGGGGGFDVVSMMFCMHYAFESEAKARGMLKNVAGALKKGGRFLGVIPNSDVLTAKVEEHHGISPRANGVRGGSEEGGTPRPDFGDDDDSWDPEKSLDAPEMAPEKPEQKEKAEEEPAEDGEVKEEGFEWGNEIYRVKFPGKTPQDGIFRPPFGWKYFYFLEEAVETVPEYVVPWEAFRALAEDYNLELQYRKPFPEVWDDEKDDHVLGPLSERMGVRGRDQGPLLVSKDELDAAGFYHAFCFYKV